MQLGLYVWPRWRRQLEATANRRVADSKSMGLSFPFFVISTYLLAVLYLLLHPNARAVELTVVGGVGLLVY